MSSNSLALAASVIVERARAHGSPTRVFMQPTGALTFANSGQYSKKILWSLFVGAYDHNCPPEWIREDIEAALKESGQCCQHCGQALPR